MGRDKGKQGAVDQNKKQRIRNPLWRPVCTQAGSSEECSVKELHVEYENDDSEKSKVINQAHEVHFAISTSVSNIEEPNSCIYGNNENRTIEEGSLLSAEKHSTSIEVAASLIRFIRGKGGSTQKRIEEELGVKIIFPSSRKEDFIIIEGSSAESLARAADKVQVILDEAVKSPSLDYSHFISLPLAIHPELVDKLVNFQNSILGISNDNLASVSNGDASDDDEDVNHQSDRRSSSVAVGLKVEDANQHVKVHISDIPLTSYPPRASTSSSLSDLGIDKSIFIKPRTFHLTILMLKLWNKERIDAATEVLKNVYAKVVDTLGSRPVRIRLKGLDCMRGSLAKARVLYAPVEEIGSEDRLIGACQVIIDAYVEAGLVLEKDANHRLKLHATVMNARHRKRKTGMRKFDSFDARDIIKKYGAEEWGEYLIREAHLSQRFTFDENGYYHCCASIPFPETMAED